MKYVNVILGFLSILSSMRFLLPLIEDISFYKKITKRRGFIKCASLGLYDIFTLHLLLSIIFMGLGILLFSFWR